MNVWEIVIQWAFRFHLNSFHLLSYSREGFSDFFWKWEQVIAFDRQEVKRGILKVDGSLRDHESFFVHGMNTAYLKTNLFPVSLKCRECLNKSANKPFGLLDKIFFPLHFIALIVSIQINFFVYVAPVHKQALSCPPQHSLSTSKSMCPHTHWKPLVVLPCLIFMRLCIFFMPHKNFLIK